MPKGQGQSQGGQHGGHQTERGGYIAANVAGSHSKGEARAAEVRTGVSQHNASKGK